MIKEGIELATEVLKLGNNLTDPEKKILRAFVKGYKNKCKAIDIAEQIFIGKKDDSIFRDNSFEGIDKLFFPRKENEEYWRLRENFNKYD
jgi:hypothetical protein